MKFTTARRVVVTGMGTVSPLGAQAEHVFQRMLRGESGVRTITRFDTRGCPCSIGGTVDTFDPQAGIEDRPTLRNMRSMDPVHQWTLNASVQAMRDAGLEEPLRRALHDGSAPPFAAHRLGISLGMGLSGRAVLEQMALKALESGRLRSNGMLERPASEMYPLIAELVAKDANPINFLQQCPSAAAAYIAMRYRAMGPNMTYVSLCAASAQALGEAAWMVARGDADLMLAGGGDSMLNLVDLTAFCALNAVTGRSHEVEEASKPFDIRRDGCVVGEGSTMLLLEELEHARARGARIYAELAGYGTSEDAYKISAPPEDGEGARQAMERALQTAGLRPEDVDHINAHGSSTPLNDKIEVTAIKRLFGQHAYKMPVVSTKSMTGHLIAGAGSLEALAAVKAIEHRTVPPTINIRKPDPLCDLDHNPGGARQLEKLDVVLSNSFAIGGVNAALVFARVEGV